MSLNLVPFESLGAVSYLPSIVTVAISVAVCEIFSVKKWRDLENQVRGRLRSLKMAPFDRPHAIFHWSAIINIALSCTIFELFDVGAFRNRSFPTTSGRGIVDPQSCPNFCLSQMAIPLPNATTWRVRSGPKMSKNA